jgi:hypothetical protein
MSPQEGILLASLIGFLVPKRLQLNCLGRYQTHVHYDLLHLAAHHYTVPPKPPVLLETEASKPKGRRYPFHRP